MWVLNHLAQAAAILLLMELLVMLLIPLGIAAGLAFGLRWVNHHTEPVFGKANTYSEKGAGYVHKGTDYAALPVIVVRKYAETAGAVTTAVQARVRRARARNAEEEEIAPAAPLT